MAGLHLLKHMYGLSDDEVRARWEENPYWQYFRGEEYFRLSLVFDRSSMTRWRGRIGLDELELLIAENLRVAMASGALSPQACERITVDTTVQTKAVAHPTDAHLLLRAMEHVCRLARKHGLQLRQSFLRLGREARREVARLIHGKGHKQALRHLRKMRTWLGRLTRVVGRKIEVLGEDGADIAKAFTETLERAEKVRTQQAEDKNKVYALHAAEVECIAKGKARTRYEFGVKTSIAVTNSRARGGQFIVGMPALPDNPFDGHTLTRQIAQVERITGIEVARAYVDRGYKGHGHKGGADVYISHTRGITSQTQVEQLRRNKGGSNRVKH
jgi:IS5 family transposase